MVAGGKVREGVWVTLLPNYQRLEVEGEMEMALSGAVHLRVLTRFRERHGGLDELDAARLEADSHAGPLDGRAVSGRGHRQAGGLGAGRSGHTEREQERQSKDIWPGHLLPPFISLRV